MNIFTQTGILTFIYLAVSALAFYGCVRIYQSKEPFFKKGISGTPLEHNKSLATVQFVLAFILGIATLVFCIVSLMISK